MTSKASGHSIYYGRVSTTEQNLGQQKAGAEALGCNAYYFDEGASGYYVAPGDRPE